MDTRLGGFTYERFASAADAPSRIAWLSRLRPNDPRAWEQVAPVLRAGGDHTGADEVLIAQRRHARRIRAVPQSRLRRAFDALQGITVRYGFRSQRAVGLLLALIAAVTVSLSVPGWAATMRASDQNAIVYAPADGCGDGKVRCLSPFFAVDTVVPIIDLKQRDTWYPGPGPGVGRVDDLRAVLHPARAAPQSDRPPRSTRPCAASQATASRKASRDE